MNRNSELGAFIFGMLYGAIIVLCFTLGMSCAHNGKPAPITVEACYYVEPYGEVCVSYDGALHFKAEIANDPLKLADVKDKLRARGIVVK